MLRRHASIDLNVLLKWANRAVAMLILVASSKLTDNRYVNGATVTLGLLLCLQTDVVLTLERLRRDPFVLILSFNITAYLAFRIFTLEVFPVSVVFLRFPYNAADSNFALIFILLANLFLYAGLFLAPLGGKTRIVTDTWVPRSPTNVVGLMVIVVVFAYARGVLGDKSAMARTSNFVASLITPETVALMALGFYALFRRSLSRSAVGMILGLIALNVIVHTIWGSRSAVVYFIQSLMVVWLAIFGRIRIQKRGLILGGLVAPIVVAGLIATFAIGTYNRAETNLGNTNSVGLAHRVEWAEAAVSEVIEGGGLMHILPVIASRAGFFDYSAEIIAHKREYESLFSWPNYLKSIVHVLTPGLHIYTTLKLSNQMEFFYRRWGTPSTSRITEYYQSDQFGVYGESFALFGYACLPLLFLGSFAFKRLYINLTTSSALLSAMRRILVLNLFAQWINSYGLDWLVADALSSVLTYLLCARVFSCRQLSITTDTLSAGCGGAQVPEV